MVLRLADGHLDVQVRVGGERGVRDAGDREHQQLERTLKISVLKKLVVGGTARDTKNNSFRHARMSSALCILNRSFSWLFKVLKKIYFFSAL